MGASQVNNCGCLARGDDFAKDERLRNENRRRSSSGSTDELPGLRLGQRVQLDEGDPGVVSYDFQDGSFGVTLDDGRRLRIDAARLIGERQGFSLNDEVSQLHGRVAELTLLVESLQRDREQGPAPTHRANGAYPLPCQGTPSTTTPSQVESPSRALPASFYAEAARAYFTDGLTPRKASEEPDPLACRLKPRRSFAVPSRSPVRLSPRGANTPRSCTPTPRTSLAEHEARSTQLTPRTSQARTTLLSPRTSQVSAASDDARFSVESVQRAELLAATASAHGALSCKVQTIQDVATPQRLSTQEDDTQQAGRVQYRANGTVIIDLVSPPRLDVLDFDGLITPRTAAKVYETAPEPRPRVESVELLRLDEDAAERPEARGLDQETRTSVVGQEAHVSFAEADSESRLSTASSFIALTPPRSTSRRIGKRLSVSSHDSCEDPENLHAVTWLTGSSSMPAAAAALAKRTTKPRHELEDFYDFGGSWSLSVPEGEEEGTHSTEGFSMFRPRPHSAEPGARRPAGTGISEVWTDGDRRRWSSTRSMSLGRSSVGSLPMGRHVVRNTVRFSSTVRTSTISVEEEDEAPSNPWNVPRIKSTHTSEGRPSGITNIAESLRCRLGSAESTESACSARSGRSKVETDFTFANKTTSDTIA